MQHVAQTLDALAVLPGMVCVEWCRIVKEGGAGGGQYAHWQVEQAVCVPLGAASAAAEASATADAAGDAAGE